MKVFRVVSFAILMVGMAFACLPLQQARAMTGSGTAGDPYVIYNVTDLQNMSNNLTAYYELANDIDASATSGWNGGAGFIPIGQNVPYFTGHFDGKGYSISSLTINRLATDSVGLFGITNGATIHDTNLTSASIKGNDFTGALLGLGLGVDTISNCSVSGTVTGNDSVGGLIGYVIGNPTTISDSYSSCSVTSDATAGFADDVGGFIGYAAYINIDRCYANGNVTASGNDIGSFIGHWVSGTVDQCFATGNVSAPNYSGNFAIGGFVGWANGIAKNCYARGSVTTSGDYAGGFSGVSPSSMENCYSTGAVSGVGSNIGGLNANLGGDVTNCFWDTQTSGQATSEGGTGKTTAQMKTKSTFTDAGWDFTTIWAIYGETNDGYPFFGGSGPPTNFLAVAISSTEIALSWDEDSTYQYTGVFSKLTDYPNSPTDAGAIMVYKGESENSVHKGLSPGTTYFYRAWSWTGSAWYTAAYDQDYATTLMGTPGIEAPPMPPEWFQTPECTAYTLLPIFPLFTGLSGGYSIPLPTVCVGVTLLWIMVLTGLTYVGTKNLLIPLPVMAVAIGVCSIAQLLPMWMMMVAIVLAGLTFFVWRRT